MAKNDTLSRLASSICLEHLGFMPTSNSVKPPHIANGLFRECTGEVCDTSDIHAWVVSERRRNAVPSEEIIERYQDILWNGSRESADGIKQIRYLMEEIFNQDNTVFPDYNFSVYSISSHWLIKKRVSSEENTGRFLFEILSKQIDGQRSPAIQLLQQALSKDDDDLTSILKPIIAFPSEAEKRVKTEVEYPGDEEISWDECKQVIRTGFDRLAANIIKTGEDGNPLLVLERMVNYAGFALFLYLSSSHYAIYGGQRIPLLLDGGVELESIKKASEQCYTSAKKAVEDFFIQTIHLILSSEFAEEDESTCQKWIDDMVFSNQARETSIRPAIRSYYDSFCSDGEPPLMALAHALQIAVYTFEYKVNSPSDFCRVLGVRCGLIGPKGNRANVKRFLINSFTLETITLSILSEEDMHGIELKELGERAREAYNLLLGTDADTDYAVLEEANIAQSTPGDLRGDLSINAQALADTYVSMGLARRYADGVTLVGWRL